MEQNFNRRIETDLDLNGPILAISSHPSDATVSDGATQTFSVTASATFPGNTGADDEGTLTYQWYEDDEGQIRKLTNETVGVTYSGTTTATLTLTGISSPAENGHKYYCVVDYTPAEKYGEDGKGTGHPINGTVTSNSATLTVNPYIQILSQPVSVDREYNVEGDISVSAVLSDSDYTDDIGYQWYLNDAAVSDGTIVSYRLRRYSVEDVVVETSTNVYEVVTRNRYSYNNTFYNSSSAQTHAIPSTASDIRIKIAGAGGGKGGNDAGGQGGSGGSGKYGEFRLPAHLTTGTTLTIYAGKKGSDGTTGGGAAGGTGGGYPNWGSGGKGGNSGGSGSSGSGGGGGGASAVYHGSLSTPIIVAGGGGGGGGASHVNLHGVDGGNPVSITYTSGYPKQQFGVHSWNGQPGKIIKYGDEGGSDANGELYITSGNATFGSYLQIVGSGPVRLQYNWSDMPNYSGRANDKIYIGNLATLEHPATRRGSNAAEFTLPGNAGAKNGGSWQTKSTLYADGGHGGHPCFCSDGGGGGGGGAGYVSSPGTGAGTGGAGGCDGVTGGTSGNGGMSAYSTTYATRFTGKDSNNSGQGYVQLSYDWYVDVTETREETVTTNKIVMRDVEESIPQNLTIEGTKGRNLTVKADYDTVENLHCVVSSPTATNSPVTTNTVQFSSFSTLTERILNIEQAFWNFDQWRGGYATGSMDVVLANSDLSNGELTLTYDDGTAYVASGTGKKGLNIFTSFYVTTDTEVEIDLYGGKGVEWTSLGGVFAPQNERGGPGVTRPYPYDPFGFSVHTDSTLPSYLGNPGGAGGYGRIRFKMKANREYTVAGMFGSINTPYLYERDELIAVVGQGGGQGVYGDGGAGGGLNRDGGWGREGANTGAGAGGRGGVYDNGNQVSDNPYANGPGMRLQAAVGSAYYPFRTDWQGSYTNNMLDHIAAHNDGAQDPATKQPGRVKRYSRSINNNSNIGTRKMLVRQVNGAASGLAEGTTIDNTANIDRGFWDIDYAFLGTAGGRSNGPSTRGDYTGVITQQALEQNAIANALGVFDQNCVGGNGAWGGAGGTHGGGGGGGAGYVYLDKGDGGITLVSTSSGSSPGNSKIVIRLAT